MAIPILEDPPDASFFRDDPQYYYAMKRKPSRTLLFLRHRASNLSVGIVCLCLVTALIHRLVTIYSYPEPYINAPSTYMNRTCPMPDYERLIDHEGTGEICIATYDIDKNILPLTWPNKFQYARKYGYQLIDTTSLMDFTRPPAWSKIRALQYLMQADCQWVVWMDAGAIIMESSMPIEHFLPNAATADMIVSLDRDHFETSVLIMRNSGWARTLLEQWWMAYNHTTVSAVQVFDRLIQASQDKIVTVPLCTLHATAHFLTLAESAAIVHNLEQQEWFLANKSYHKGDFLAHVPQYCLEKQQCIQLLLQEAQ